MDATKGTAGLLGLLTTFVLGGASGYAARLGLEGDPRRGEAGSSVEASHAGMESVLADIRSTLERLERRLDVPHVPPTPAINAREPLEPDKEPMDLAALRELVTKFERAAQAISARSPALFIPDGRPQPLPALPEDDAAKDALIQHYQLWSYQQVLDAFGRPDSVTSGDHVEWWYDRDQGGWFVLTFGDGYVVDVLFQ